MNEYSGPDREFWKNRRVFLTGSTGFVGSWLAKELLSLGADIVAFTPPYEGSESELCRSGDIDKIHTVLGWVEDFDALHNTFWKYTPETVFHLAAQTQVKEAYDNPLQTMETNIRGTYNLLEVCHRYKSTTKQVVIASSDKAYGVSSRAGLPYTESDRIQGKYPYDVSKSCADLLAQAYAHTYNLPIGITRCGNIYGGGDMNWERLIPGTIRSLYFNESPIIRSDGKYVRDYIYVKDVVSAYLCLAEALDNNEVVWGQAFNFSNEHPISVLDMVTTIQRRMGREDLQVEIQDTAKAEIYSQCLSGAKARQWLGWQAQFCLDTGLRQTIDYYTKFFKETRYD